MFPKLRRALCLCLTLVLVTALVVSASASGTYGYGSIEICYEVDDKPISNKEFQLYRVGNVNNDLDFSWTTEYADYNLNLDVTSVEVMHNLPSVLAGYVSRDKKNPTAKAVTDNGGACVFSDLDAGIYLLTGRTWSSGSYTYRIVPVLVCLPYTDISQTLSMKAEVAVKHESTYTPPFIPTPTPTPTPQPSEPITPSQSVSVEKYWDVRPGTVVPSTLSVDLLCDGELYSRVNLSAETGWNYSWFNLPAGHEWMVVETSVPDGYSGSLRRNGQSFILVNLEAGKPPEEPVESTSPIPTPTPEPPVQTPPPSNDPNLPQTGLTRWPIIAFGAVGCIFVLVSGGFAIADKRKASKGHASK